MTVFSELASIIRHYRLGSVDAAVFLRHLHHASRRHDWRHSVGSAQIACDADVSPENVRRSEAKLARLGLIEQRPRAGGRQVKILDPPRTLDPGKAHTPRKVAESA